MELPKISKLQRFGINFAAILMAASLGKWSIAGKNIEGIYRLFER